MAMNMTDKGAEHMIVRAHPEVKFRCVLDRILVEEIKVEASRVLKLGELQLERSQKFEEKSLIGRVLAVGDGVPMGGVLMPMPYKVGQTVMCSEYGRTDWYAKPEDKIDKTVPRRYLIRVADTMGEPLA